MSKTYSGSCLCKGIKFEVSGFSDLAANCHCSMCRKFHGAAYGTLVGARGLKWVKGECLLRHYTAENGTVRTFCGSCGSSIGFRVEGAGIDQMEVAIAAFDEDIPVEVDANIFTAYKASWCKLDPEIVAFAEGRTE